MLSRVARVILVVTCVIGLSWASVVANEAGAKEQVVIQVSDDNPKTWNQALNVVRNIQRAYGKDNVDVEVVAFGHGIGMLKMDSVVGNRVDDAVKAGVQVNACQNTMRGQKLAREDMLRSIGYVPAGVIEIVRKQRKGWAVLRP
ncbi:MAG: DsrE family protein [Rubricoccaceae bacterium]|nr:DsrE family protein [Rubricoccaceae bacterium]